MVTTTLVPALATRSMAPPIPFTILPCEWKMKTHVEMFKSLSLSKNRTKKMVLYLFFLELTTITKLLRLLRPGVTNLSEPKSYFISIN